MCAVVAGNPFLAGQWALQFPSAPFMAETCKLKVKFYANSDPGRVATMPLDSMAFNKVIGFLSFPSASQQSWPSSTLCLSDATPPLSSTHRSWRHHTIAFLSFFCHLLFFTSTLQIFMAESSVNNKLINCSDDVCVTGHWTKDTADESIFKMNYVCSYAIRTYIFISIEQACTRYQTICPTQRRTVPIKRYCL